MTETITAPAGCKLRQRGYWHRQLRIAQETRRLDRMPVRIVQSKQNSAPERTAPGAGLSLAASRRWPHRRSKGQICWKKLCGQVCASTASLRRRKRHTSRRNTICRSRDRDTARAAGAAALCAGHRDAAAGCRADRAAEWTWAHLLELRNSRAADRGPRRPAGSGQPRHDPALGRSLWRGPASLLCRARERVEPESCARLGGQRLPSCR